jgi:hypothetical protein
MEVIYSSETSVDFQRTTRRYIPEDSTLQITIAFGWFRLGISGGSYEARNESSGCTRGGGFLD